MGQVKNLDEIKAMIRAQVRARFSRRPYGKTPETPEDRALVEK